MKRQKQTSEDFDLVRAFRAGDEKAFEEIIGHYQRQVANLIYLTLGGPDLVEDLSQEVFIRVYRSLSKFEFDASLYSWIYRITLNLCIDEIRRRRIKRTFSLDFFSKESAKEVEGPSRGIKTPGESILDDEKKEIIRAALQQLSPSHRTVLVLREYEDLSYGDISKLLKVSIQAVKSRIFRAREEMKELLADYFKERV